MTLRVDISNNLLDEEEEIIPDPSNKNGCYLMEHKQLSLLLKDWLDENCKGSWQFHDDSVNYPAGIDFDEIADALLFKLTFGGRHEFT